MTPTSQQTADGPSQRPVQASDAIAHALVEHGVDRVFLMTGGDLNLWRAFSEAGIQMCLARSEPGSVAMADAYARTTGRVRGVRPMGTGRSDRGRSSGRRVVGGSPVLALTSTAPTTSQYKFEYQELEQEPMFSSLTKWQARISRADRAAELVSQALRIAESGAPGPVHIDIPSDLVKQPLGDGHTSRPPARPLLTSPSPDEQAISEIVRKVRGATRPVLLAGGGVLASGGAVEFAEFAKVLNVPVATTMGGKGSFPRITAFRSACWSVLTEAGKRGSWRCRPCHCGRKRSRWTGDGHLHPAAPIGRCRADRCRCVKDRADDRGLPRGRGRCHRCV